VNVSARAHQQFGITARYNGIGAILTRRGEGLIGFNFNLSGGTAQPDVAVNPLSLFTPGMFREIFRRKPPEQE